MEYDQGGIEVGDIVIALNDKGDLILESIGCVSQIIRDANPDKYFTITVVYYSTSALYRNSQGYYHVRNLKRLTDPKDVYRILSAREKARQYKTFEEVK